MGMKMRTYFLETRVNVKKNLEVRLKTTGIYNLILLQSANTYGGIQHDY